MEEQGAEEWLMIIRILVPSDKHINVFLQRQNYAIFVVFYLAVMTIELQNLIPIFHFY